MEVTVLFSPAARVVHVRRLELPEGATVAEAVTQSGWEAEVCRTPEGEPMLGVWGRKAPADQVLQPKDRVEIYRPLTVDPKLARRTRFVKQGARAAGLFARRRPGAKAGY